MAAAAADPKGGSDRGPPAGLDVDPVTAWGDHTVNIQVGPQHYFLHKIGIRDKQATAAAVVDLSGRARTQLTIPQQSMSGVVPAIRIFQR